MLPRLLTLVLLATSALLAATAATAPTRPNVLFLFSDDLRPELGCYGVAGIKTPHIDKLAAQSVRFDRAYVQYPLCNPSRASMLSGRYPTTTGILDNNTFLGRVHPGWLTLPAFFKQHGYTTLRAGKIFHGGFDDTAAWSEGGEPRPLGDKDRTGGSKQDPARSDTINVLPGDGETHGDYRSASRAIEYLRRYKSSSSSAPASSSSSAPGPAPIAAPFFLACGFSKPHSPPTAPKKFFDLYPVEEISLPRDYAPRPTPPAGFPALSVPARNSDLFIGRDSTEKEAREMKRAYWASVSFVDEQVGRVLATLDELGLRESTLVVLWGDHGYHLGEKGKWSKANSLWELGTRVPLLISVPRSPANGKVSPRIVESLSLYPTLAELCGLPRPDGVQGASLAPLLRDPQAPWDRPAFTVTRIQNTLGRAVRTDRWRYVEWSDGKDGAMLIDMQADPLELTNLAADPRHAATVAEMKTLLQRLPASSGN